ncbi:MAG: phytanoyl-CoA dioxygenase family protein [Candidatus Promineifilaceae bacterium]
MLDLKEFDALCKQTTHLSDYPCAMAVEKNIVIYDGDAMRDMLADPAQEAVLRAELTRCLNTGPGVFAVSKMYADTNIIEKSTDVFRAIVSAEKAASAGKGDHFGNNERIWNSLQKACVYDPDLFIDYYSNPILAIACQAWLGPNYQMSAQMNNVKPGNAAQSAHRDYHLGFQSRATIAQYPAHAQTMSQYLTLQGAVVHGDTPLEKGPTLFLPYSQQYAPGYLAFRDPEFAAYFDEHKVQIPFKLGDGVFFSPALFHGAGTNTTETDRIANLVQISSAFGRTMETINRTTMIEAVYPALQARIANGTIGERMIHDTIASTAEGYSFPTNLDSDPPIGGNAPETAAQMMHKALQTGSSLNELKAQLTAYAQRRQA